MTRAGAATWPGEALSWLALAWLALSSCQSPEPFHRGSGRDPAGIGPVGQGGGAGHSAAPGGGGGDDGSGGSTDPVIGAGGAGAESGEGGETGGEGGGGVSTGGAGGVGAGPGTGGGGADKGGAGGSGGGAFAGSGGTTGSGGRLGFGGRDGLGGRGSGGSTGTGGRTGACGGVFCDNFESYPLGDAPSSWRSVGGLSTDWSIMNDASQALVQAQINGTFRLSYPASAPTAPWTGATTISAQVKLQQDGTDGTPSAFVCVRYVPGIGGDYYCLTIQRLVGAGAARIRTRIGGTLIDGPLWNMPIALGVWYDVRLRIDAAGTLTAFVGGTLLGTYAPAAISAPSFVAVATQYVRAEFDNIVVTRP